MSKIHINKYLEYIVDSMPGIFYWKDRKGIYLGCNNFKMPGLEKPTKIIGKTDYELYKKKEADLIQEHDTYVMTTGNTLHVEEKVTLPNGEAMEFIVDKMPLKDKSGKIIGLIGTSLDITELKKTQEALTREKQKAEKSSHAKSEFIANISHDIRTPMAGVCGMLDGLLLAVEDAQSALQLDPKLSLEKVKALFEDLMARTQEYTEIAKISTHDLLQLFNQILETIRLESGKVAVLPEGFDLRKLVQQNIRLLQSVADHKKTKVYVDIDPQVPLYFKGLRSYLNRTLLNLLSNALKFTEKGRVCVRVRLLDSVKPSYVQGDSVTLQIQVEDSGIGIPEDKFDEIFEHFSRLTPSYQGIYKGSGLGLYAVKRYVEAMEGNIEVESKVDKGSCFTVTLPLIVENHIDKVSESLETLAITQPATSSPSFNSSTVKTQSTAESATRVLLVEDSLAAAMATRMVLEHMGCSVDVAKDGAQALKKASCETYDLIFMDIGLPDISGIEMAKQIRALSDTNKSHVPILALTGHAGGDSRQVCLSSGMNDVLTKPAQPLVLQSALQEWVWDHQNDTIPSIKSGLSNIDALPIIDWEGCMIACMDDEKMLRKLLTVMVDDLKEITQPKLTAAYLKRNTQALRAELHRCIGGIVYLRLPQLEHALKAFQKAIKTEPQDSQELETTYTALQQAIQTFLEAAANRLF